MSGIRTLQIIGSKRLGGAEGFFLRLHEALVRADDINSTAITPRDSELNLGVAAPFGHAPMRSVFDPFSRIALGRLIRRHQPDVVQTWMGRASRLVRLPERGAPVHVARLGGFYNPARYRHAHALVGNTRGICDFLVNSGVPTSRVHQIGNFVPQPRVVSASELGLCRERLGIPADARVIFSLGRLHENKAFDTLLQAFEQLHPMPDGRQVHLILAGDGPLAATLQHQTAESPMMDRIHWLGWQHDPSPWFCLADAFVCPSRHEPLGNVLLEAWAHGCPLVSTRTAGALELVEDGVTGLLCEIDEPHHMAGQIQALLNAPPSHRLQLAEHGREVLQKNHSEEAVVRAYGNLYRQLLDGKH